MASNRSQYTHHQSNNNPTKPPSFRLTPKKFTDNAFRAAAEKCPVITFYCSHDNGQRVEKLRINQAFFFRDSVSNVPQLIEQSEGEENLYDFRELIEAEPEKDVEAEWEAFGSFKS